MSETLDWHGWLLMYFLIRKYYVNLQKKWYNCIDSPIGRLYINRVIHKTYISVDEQGTKAGASTVTEVMASSAPQQEETMTVYLDQPFVYMIFDIETGIPFFMGTVLDL